MIWVMNQNVLNVLLVVWYFGIVEQYIVGWNQQRNEQIKPSSNLSSYTPRRLASEAVLRTHFSI